MNLNSKKIKILMIEKEITIDELSKLSGLSGSSISLIRSGKSCRRESAEAIAKALNVNLDDILLEERSVKNVL